MAEVFVLVVEVGRRKGDGLPDGATGAALVCLATGKDEAEAVRETVAVLKRADLAPLDVTGYGTPEAAAGAGLDLGDDIAPLVERARAENAVIVVETTVFRGGDLPDGGGPR